MFHIHNYLVTNLVILHLF